MVDPGFNAILIRSASDLAALAEALGEHGIAAENRAYAEVGRAAMDGLWSERHGQYLCRDRVSGDLIDSVSIRLRRAVCRTGSPRRSQANLRQGGSARPRAR